MIPERIAELAADRLSGASALVARAIEILRDALAGEADVIDTARALVRAQPSMAPMWNAALAALVGPARFDAFVMRVRRAPAALVENALHHFPAPPRHIITISSSGSVATVIEAFVRRSAVRVTCSESAPAMEGRALAARLAAAGARVSCTRDDEIDAAVAGADAVLIGADAVAARWFVNKTGTRSLVASATASHVPVYVAATRDKFASPAIAARLAPNPLFEATPLASVAGVLSDDGVLQPDVVRRICEAPETDTTLAFIALLHTASPDE